MKRAVAGIVILFALLALAVFVPAVPASATAQKSNAGTSNPPCSATLAGCIFAGESVEGYGSVSYYLTGRGAFYFQGSYQLMTSTNLTVSVSA
jgi:hypothetical protein